MRTVPTDGSSITSGDVITLYFNNSPTDVKIHIEHMLSEVFIRQAIVSGNTVEIPINRANVTAADIHFTVTWRDGKAALKYQVFVPEP